jgi:hypothetical protein
MTKVNLNVNEFVQDMRDLKTDTELMDKHGLDARGLRNAFDKLIEMKLLTYQELDERYRKAHEAPKNADMRVEQRNYLCFLVPVLERGNQDKPGRLIDVTETGLQVAGIPSEIGKKAVFTIHTDAFPLIKPFDVDVICRWVGQKDEDGEFAAGYEITHIGKRDSDELLKLIRSLSLA